jgi:L-fuconolactonase
MATLAGLPNVSVKLSGLTTEASEDWSSAEIEPYAELLLSTFGPSRMLFGSDWPVCLLAGSYSETASLAADLISALSPSEQAAVFGGNAIEWYSLGAIDRATTTTSQLSRIDLI